ncbi:AlpA family phage regulatory protein [Mameliella alba]|uniref:helix-turn-helix transcriptional regulator n=1 Tax=Mameliella alba TaxID=561184 RepID=UPI001C949E32|nr:AlpA family phage regulatory protein [Mameliella alba]MBY6119813.1 AlpA family phage regulatory protein [Mameliella alba]
MSDQQAEPRIPSLEVRRLCGGISRPTLHRWLNDSEMQFPKPVKLGARNYWLESEIVTWIDGQSEEV